jgi:transposase
VIADRDYSARGHRADLHRRGITAVIPEPADQAAHRRRRGSAGGRPVGYDRAAYRGRNVIKRTFNQLKASRGIAARYDKHATVFTARSSSSRSSSGYGIRRRALVICQARTLGVPAQESATDRPQAVLAVRRQPRAQQ